VFGPLLLIVGCGLTGLAVVLPRLVAADRKLFRGAERVIGEVVEIVPASRSDRTETARIGFRYKDRDFTTLLQPEIDEEGNQLTLSYRAGDRVHLLVPPGRPQAAAPARGIRNTLYGGPAALALLGAAAFGFGLLLTTGSMAVAGPLIAGVWIGGFGLLIYLNRK